MSAPKFETVEKLVACRKCGDGLTAWRESKGGKFFLVTAHVSNGRTFRVKAAAPYEFHACIPDATPKAIDSSLAELWTSRDDAKALAVDARLNLRAIENGTRRPFGNVVEHYNRQLDDASAWIAKIDLLIEPFEAEFERRGGWLRYFLVQNSGGHVHRERTCTTCFDTTRYAWLVDLADCDEEKMVEQYGTTACTVCFPNAPTMPGWARDAEAEAAKAAKTCPRSGEYVGFGGGSRYVQCETCGDHVVLTKNGNLRKHNRKTAEVVS